jgi:hypothetical protein
MRIYDDWICHSVEDDTTCLGVENLLPDGLVLCVHQVQFVAGRCEAFYDPMFAATIVELDVPRAGEWHLTKHGRLCEFVRAVQDWEPFDRTTLDLQCELASLGGGDSRVKM